MPLSKRLLKVAADRAPVLARAITTPAVAGAVVERGAAGTTWRSEQTPRALVVYLTGSPGLSRWLAGSVAVRLDALVLVPAAVDTAAVEAAVIEAAVTDVRSDSRLADHLPLVIVGEADAAASAIAAGTALGAARLALLYPTGLPVGSPEPRAPMPTTLIQAAADGADRGTIVAIDAAWRRAGIAVRETEYAGVDDGWARYPRASRGSRRALDDLIGFLDRGIGQASTFDVIPGWDLH